MAKEVLEINDQFKQVISFINETNSNLFLTGKAGTGKTTLLKYIRQNTFKQMAVLAPTGVAAINANGTTIHSFFQFPFTPFLPTLRPSDGLLSLTQKNLPVLKYNNHRLAIFRSLELLIIDEISMVRADLLDQIDVTLRQTRRRWNEPFGGVQILLIGDMHQLPPVVPQAEWQLLSEVYQSPFFFDSLAISNNPPVYIELTKIYRQNETNFIEILNKVRNNQLDDQTLQLLNSHYQPQISAQTYQNSITLTTHNRKADEINTTNLAHIKSPSFTYSCQVEGQFLDKNYPADAELTLKKGTRVMFLKNNPEKNYYNGKIGTVSYLNANTIKVICPSDENEDEDIEIEVSPHEWHNITYSIDTTTKHLHEEIIGKFTQYPLRLAWAITIHKSQGLTFDEMILDASESFTAGQVYVALSRCRSLSGLTLSTPINRHNILRNNKVSGFEQKKTALNQLPTLLTLAQNQYYRSILIHLFDCEAVYELKNELNSVIIANNDQLNTKTTHQTWILPFYEQINTLFAIANKFKPQLQTLLEQAPQVANHQPLQTRINQAATYFITQLQEILNQIKNNPLITESKETAAHINAQLQILHDACYEKKYLLGYCALNGFHFPDFIQHKLKIKYPDEKLSIYAIRKSTQQDSETPHPKLYKKLQNLRDDICEETDKPIYMVLSNNTLKEMVLYLPASLNELLQITGFGKTKIAMYGMRFLSIIIQYMQQHDLNGNMPLATKETKTKNNTPKTEKAQPSKLNTFEESYKLFEQGLTPAQIASKRNLAYSTICGHLTKYIANGQIDIEQLITPKQISIIMVALQRVKNQENPNLKMVKDLLPTEIEFHEIRWVLASMENES